MASDGDAYGEKRKYSAKSVDIDENEAFKISVDLSSPEPIYKQIYNCIVKNIAIGMLKKGDKLPSSRELSSILGINYHTVNKAYSELENDEYIYQDRRKHVIVSGIRKEHKTMNPLWEKQIKNLILEAISSGFSVDEIKAKINDLIEEALNQEGN
ncbi:GntR family transcriptional regulator [Acidiplasma sp.]|uniref:GntR family transcriptional regulator n=1 Tax=Acidiplasma sp. TaxID=1872114 RepID=UPI00258BC846|nr:GntR family transcriptional regulator [Acidiplasma sp.]